MRRALLAILVLIGQASGAAEPVAMVRGTDPAQFDLVGLTAGSIAIEGGEIRLTGQPLGYFATKAEYGDFVLTFEFRYDRPEGLKSDAHFRGNSGVLLRVAGPAKVWPSCVQVQLAQADPGTIFALGEARAEAGADPVAQKAAIRPVGEWNQVRVTSRGGLISSVLNGVEVARAMQVEPARGAIGWQSEGKPVRFRDLKIETTEAPVKPRPPAAGN